MGSAGTSAALVARRLILVSERQLLARVGTLSLGDLDKIFDGKFVPKWSCRANAFEMREMKFISDFRLF